jgi:hypothetical protein
MEELNLVASTTHRELKYVGASDQVEFLLANIM